MYVIDLKYSVCIAKVPLEERVSQTFDLSPRFYFM